MKKLLNKLKKYLHSKPLALLYLFIPIFVSVTRLKLFDNDFWFITNTGKYILNHGFPTIEPFTIHSNLSFVIQQWLTDIIFYGIYKYLGHTGIIALLFILELLIIYLLYKICYMVSEKRLSISIAVTAVSVALLNLLFMATRPQMFDFVILLSAIYVLEKYIRTNNSKILWWLVLLSFLLINLHASTYFVLFLFMLPYLVDSFKFKISFLNGEGYRKKPLFLILIPMLLVGLINPYGIKNITYIFTSFGVPAINGVVGEMESIRTTNISIRAIYLIVFNFIVLGNILNRKNLKVRYLCLELGTLILGFSSIKGMSFLLVGGTFPICYNLKEYFKEYKGNYKYSKRFIITYIMILIGLFSLFFVELNKVDEEKDITSYYVNLRVIADYLDDNTKSKDVTLYTDYDTGSYFEYRGYKCYIDPRAEVFLKANNTKEDIIDEYYNLQKNKLNEREFIDKYGFNYLVVNSKADILYKYLNKNGSYEMLTKSGDFYLYNKK